MVPQANHGSLNYHRRKDELSFIYRKKETSRDTHTDLLTTNEHVSPDRAMGLAKQYDQRMEIETTYQTIKGNFLPKTNTNDYRLRFSFFIIGALLYNVWRLSNFVLRDNVDGHLGDDPEIPAGEIIEIVAMFMFDPGD